jgi:glycosyltransferase involved in cell wall biosynthesis
MDTNSPVLFAISCAEVGGAQRSLTRLLEGLDRRAFPPYVLLGEGGPLERMLTGLGVRYEITPRPFRTIGGIKHFVRTARRERIRIVHLLAARTLAIAARTMGLAVVERVNLLRGPDAGGFVTRPWMDRALLRLAHRVIVPSRAMQRQLVSRGVPGRKVRLVRNGVRPMVAGAGTGELRAGLGLAPDACVVLSVARLARIKGLDLLIDAIARAQLTWPHLVLVIAGEGLERPALEARARAAGVNMRFLGNRSDIGDLLAACDIYVQPSRSECSGQALVEAMLAGCAVVASDTGGVREIVRDGVTGLLVPVGDVAALSAAIGTLTDDAARRAWLGGRARACAAALPGLDAMCRATEAVYHEALSCR